MGAWHYRRAGCRSADETLTYTPRLYRSVVKDSAVWEVCKRGSKLHGEGTSCRARGRRRSRTGDVSIAGRGPTGSAGEVATSTRRHRIRRRRADGGAVIKDGGFSLNAGRSPSRAKEVGSHCTPRRGAPEKERGRGGREKRVRFAFPRTAHIPNVCRALVKTAVGRSPPQIGWTVQSAKVHTILRTLHKILKSSHYTANFAEVKQKFSVEKGVAGAGLSTQCRSCGR